MTAWAADIARAYGTCRATHPEDTALVVCDLDALHEPGRPDEPCRGVLDILRWFRFQPLTDVAVVAHRPESERPAVQARLDELARDRAPGWHPGMVHLRPDETSGEGPVPAPGTAAHVLVAVLTADRPTADALRRCGESELDDAAVVPVADLLADRRDRSGPAPSRVELVWHQVDDEVRIRQMLGSPVRWAEIDARCDPDGRLTVHHDDDPASGDGERPPELEGVLRRMAAAGKGANLDVKDPEALGPALAAAARAGLDDTDLWVTGRVDTLGERALRPVAASHPGARLQVPIEPLATVVAAMPRHADAVLDELTAWGVGRFSVAWTHPQRDLLLTHPYDRGGEVDVHAVTDLETFMTSVLALPHSITADLTVPEWHYSGRGSGNDGAFHRDPKAAATSPGIDTP